MFAIGDKSSVNLKKRQHFELKVVNFLILGKKIILDNLGNKVHKSSAYILLIVLYLK